MGRFGTRRSWRLSRHPSHQGLRHRLWQRRTSAPQIHDTNASQLRCASALVDLCRLQASVAHSAPLRAQSRTTQGAAWRAEPLWGQQLSAPPGQAFGVRSVLGTETTEGLGALERVVSRGSTAYAVNPLEAPSRLTLGAPRRGGLPEVGTTRRQPLGGLSQAHPWGHREWGTPRSWLRKAPQTVYKIRFWTPPPVLEVQNCLLDVSWGSKMDLWRLRTASLERLVAQLEAFIDHASSPSSERSRR